MEDVAKVTKAEGQTTEEVVKELESQGAVVESVDPNAVIAEYLADEKVQENLNEMAIHFSEVSKNKWVSVREIQKRSRVKKPEELTMLLDLLVLAKKAISKKVGDIFMYRFTLDKNQRKKVLTRYIAELKSQVSSLEEELNSL